jgi:hypothetical protein
VLTFHQGRSSSLSQTLKEVSLIFVIYKLSRVGIEGWKGVQVLFSSEKTEETENIESVVTSCFVFQNFGSFLSRAAIPKDFDFIFIPVVKMEGCDRSRGWFCNFCQCCKAMGWWFSQINNDFLRRSEYVVHESDLFSPL